MDNDTRDLIDRLGAELAGIMEDASVDAALLRGVDPRKLNSVIDNLADAADRAKILTSAMRRLIAQA